jgi:hypothetical protein
MLQKIYMLFILPLALFIAVIHAETVSGYTRPLAVSEEIWDAASQHFLLETHPLKETLDAIFLDSRAIYCEDSMRAAGFINPKPQKHTHMVVTRHPDLPGLVIKTYFDCQRYFEKLREDEQWLQRIEGARLIQELIDAKGWGGQFKVPKKWIYPLPPFPKPSKKFQGKYFILVEEDMDLCDSATNKALWKSSVITFELLDQVYFIVTELGLYDSPSTDNLPFSNDGRLAFIDTQYFHIWPVGYNKLYPALSKEMLSYWKVKIME